ncbi:MAG: hypothetical protein JWP04_1190 [Belnapia sp.]|nr:hypothetical protein [Belnapia sp.]
MRRATGISLVLLGGGLAFGLSTCDATSEECRAARAAGRPDAEQLCRNTRSGGSHSGSGGSRGNASGGDSLPASSRGGFGGFASHFSGGG